MSVKVRGVALGVVFAAVLAHGATWVVCPTGCSFSTVQEAIAAASPGDTVLVQPGTYRGDLWVKKPLDLRGEGSAPTVIEGRLHVLAVSQVTVVGFSFHGGGIHLEDSSGILVADCDVGGGGGIVVRSSSVTLRGSTVTDAEGHGILVTLGSRALVDGCAVLGSGGDGIHIAASMADLRGNEVHRSGGYGIWADERATVAGVTTVAFLSGNARGTVGGAARSLDRDPPGAPASLTVSPADWTAGPIAIGWTSPVDLTGAAAAWYTIGAPPRSPEESTRAAGNPFLIAAPPEGRRVVYVWLEDHAGNRNPANRAEVTVLSDRTPPSGKAATTTGGYVFATQIELQVEATDLAGSEPGSGVASVRLSNDGKTWGPWQLFAKSLNWNLAAFGGTGAPGPKTVFVELRDKAGNVGRLTVELTLVQMIASMEPILCLAFTGTGDRLAYGSPAGMIRILDFATGQELRTLRGHTGGVYAIAFSPDGKSLVSGANDNTARVWDLTTGKELRVLRGHTGAVWTVAFASDGKTVASGSSDSTIRLWDASTGRHLRTLEEHAGPVRAVAFSPDGKLLASGSDDRTVRVWDPATGRRKHTITEHTEAVRSVAFSPDGKALASASLDGKVGLWDPATGRVIRTIRAHAEGVRSVAFAPDGKTIASGSTKGKVAAWSAATGKELQVLEGHTDSVNALAYSPDGRTLASGGSDTTLRLWPAGP